MWPRENKRQVEKWLQLGGPGQALPGCPWTLTQAQPPTLGPITCAPEKEEQAQMQSGLWDPVLLWSLTAAPSPGVLTVP
jgi:hypothetical protein